MNDLLSADEVEQLAAKLGLTLTQLAAKAGIAHTTLTRWKRGETRPTLDVYERVVAALRSAKEAA